MKIIIVNSRYFPSAGPEKYLFSISEVLEKHGHEVIPFSIKNSRNLPTKYAEYFAENIGGGDELYFENMDSSLGTRIQLVVRQFYSLHVRERLEGLIRETNADVVYILHHQTRLSPSVISACKNRGVPVVLRISDFSLVCTKGSLLRDGKVCELCLTDGLWNGVKHKCVKSSRVGSTVKAIALASYRLSKIYRKVDRVVVPSQFTIGKLKGIFGEELMTHVPTLVLPDQNSDSFIGEYALFVGRVEEEKGLIHAIKAFEENGFPLKIVGYSHSGYADYLMAYVRDRALENIEFLGPKFGSELDEIYRNCRFVILPVVWYENLPNVALEAMLHSKPVVASNIGSMPEVVRHNETGLLFETANVKSCSSVVISLFHDDDLVRRLGAAAYACVTTEYSPAMHYEKLMKIFKAVTGNCNA